MKQVILSLGVVASLSACTVVPVPVAVIQPKSTTTVAHYPALPNTLPVAYHPNYAPSPTLNRAVVRPQTITPAPITAPTTRVYQPTVLPQTSVQDLSAIAEKIYLNETAGDRQKLVRWHNGGNYAVLGIGHFTWYPNNHQVYKQNDTFPELLHYMQMRGVILPAWLAKRPARGGPWKNRSEFDSALNDAQMLELQAFLARTKNLQANFMLDHLKQARPELLSQFNTHEQALINQNYQTLIKTPEGLYVLLDYLSFKGDGLNPNDRYRNQGWGLAHVLLTMQPTTAGARALEAFRLAAEDVLLQRIANAPLERREARFLNSWRARLNTYQANTLARL